MQRSLSTILLPACLVLLAAAPSELSRSIESLWRSGMTGEAIQMINSELAAGNTDPAFIEVSADVMMEQHRYAEAAELYLQLAQASSSDLDQVREYKIREWRARYRLAGGSSSADWISAEQQSLPGFVESVTGQQGQGRRRLENGPGAEQEKLLLELQYCLREETGNRPARPEELVRRFPDSMVTLRLAAADATELGTISNDRERIEAVSAYLESWPRNYWRHVAFRYWLYSAWRLHDEDELLLAADSYLTEFGGSAESHGAVSRYMLDLGIDEATAMQHARRSVELFELEIGTTGDLTSISTLHSETRRLEPQLPYLPPGPRRTFLLYMASRHNLARHLNRAGEHDEALDTLVPVIGVEPFLPTEEETLAPYLLEAGNAQLGIGNDEAAYRFYLQAAFTGDSTNRYSGQAAEKLKQLEDSLSADTIEYETSRLLPPVAEVSSIPVFSDVSFSTEVFRHQAARVTWIDINSDRAPDMVLDGSTVLMNELGRFRDRTGESGLLGNAGGAVAGDFDNDGRTDLYCFGNGRDPDRVYLNQGGSFRAVDSVRGDGSSSEAAVLVDLDGDGWLDAYTVNFESPGGMRREGDSLLLNEGAGNFRLADPSSLGMLPPLGDNYAGRGAAAGDLNGDGLPDILVGNYRLERNMAFSGLGNGRYRETARSWNLAGSWKDGNWGNSIGPAFGDIDNDGDLDVFIANLSNPRFEHLADASMLLLNNLDTDGSFEDVTVDAGIRFNSTNACPIIFDANNDGWQDIFVTSIYPGRSSHLYVNDGRGGFVDLSYISNARVQDAYGAAVADYDNDGDLDIAIASVSGCRLLRNDSPQRNWISFLVEGSMGSDARFPAGVATSNRSAIGTRLTIRHEGQVLVRELQSGNGSGCGNELRVFFGLGDIRGPFDVEVRYPGGLTQNVFIRRPNKHFMVSELDAFESPGESTGEEDSDAEDEVSRRLYIPE